VPADALFLQEGEEVYLLGGLKNVLNINYPEFVNYFDKALRYYTFSATMLASCLNTKISNFACKILSVVHLRNKHTFSH
jgi:hypothetical protein